METKHSIIFSDSAAMGEVADKSVRLVVTSPPYPMVEMWDELFSESDRQIAHDLQSRKGSRAFENMHRLLDRVWIQLGRVIGPGGIVCINIGDAVRSIGGRFRLFANHARITEAMLKLGFDLLPSIIWRKPTSSPTKFMGSGMLPPSAYVTLEHEFILVFRKGGAREFMTSAAKSIRRKSAFFWEERNKWFSDVWLDLPGADQNLNGRYERNRSAAYPIELAYRLINMYSVQGDTVLDPFLGTGTTLQAAMASGRNSIGFENDPGFKPLILEKISRVPELANEISKNRLNQHVKFVKERQLLMGPLKHWNDYYGFGVMTKQETDIQIPFIKSITYLSDNRFRLSHQYPKLDSAAGEKIQVHGNTINKLNTIRVKERQLRLFPS